MSLCSDPDLLLLDEPTSGLDSRKAKTLVDDLRQLTNDDGAGVKGVTVISTIHQPSAEVFRMFKKVFLLAGHGEAVFFGTVQQLIAKFKELGCPVPADTNPADHVMDVLETLPEVVRKMKKSYDEEVVVTNSLSEPAGAIGVAPAAIGMVDVASGPGAAGHSCAGVAKRGPVVPMFKVLLHRSFTCMKREPFLTKIRLAQTVFIGLMVGFLFFQLEKNVVGVRNRSAVAFLLCLTQLLFSALGMLNVFIGERPVFLREALDRLYTPWQFWLSKVLLDIPLQSFYAGLTVCIVYYLIGLNQDSFDNFLVAVLVIMLQANVGSSFGFIVSAKAGSIDKALAITPVVVLPQVLLSGFMIDVESMPLIPFGALSYVTPFRYAWQALVFNEFNCKEPDASCRTTAWLEMGHPGTATLM